MIDRFRSRFSSAHLVAGAALLFAVGGGSAVALKGVNSVNSGDVRNNSLRGADVQRNSLKGADIREATLKCSAIPSVDCSADDAAEGAGVVAEPDLEGIATAADGDSPAAVLETDGFQFTLECSATSVSRILLDNVSAGADSRWESIGSPGAEDHDFDQGETAILVVETNQEIETVVFSIVGSNGALVNGQATVVDNPQSGFGGADCVGLVTVA